MFGNSEITGDLNYFINGLKYFAQILIEDGIDDLEIEEGIQPFWTASGLINFITSAEDLFRSADLTRQQYATLVNAVFAGQSLIKALYHVFKNRRFLFKNVLDEHHAMSNIHLRDLVRIAKQNHVVTTPQDSSSAAISPKKNDFEHAQHGSSDKKTRNIGNADGVPDMLGQEFATIQNKTFLGILSHHFNTASMNFATIPCLDSSLSKAQVFAILQRSGRYLSIDLPFHPGLSLHPVVWSELIYGNNKLLSKLHKDVLWKFDIRYHAQSCILKRALFRLS